MAFEGDWNGVACSEDILMFYMGGLGNALPMFSRGIIWCRPRGLQLDVVEVQLFAGWINLLIAHVGAPIPDIYTNTTTTMDRGMD